ncbi:MAG: hypothetical protein JW827_02365 [Spirochaetes bacterium]|nr:hypothetical protein [Spirochaetota bacterium]
MKKVNIIFIFVLILATCLQAKVWVSPPYKEILISNDKSKKYVVYYTIGNTAENDVTIYVELKNGRQFLKDGAKNPGKPLPVSHWVNYDGEKVFTLKANERKKLVFFIIPPGGDYTDMSAFISFIIDEGTMIKSAITVPFYAIVKENAEFDLAIKDFELIKKSTDNLDYICQIKIIFKNHSNIHIRPKASLVIKDENSKPVKHINMGDLAPMFDTGDIQYSNDLDLKLGKGKYTAELYVKYYFFQKELKMSKQFEVNEKGECVFY